MEPWRKAPQEVQDRFGEIVAGVDDLELRRMFGYPAAFLNGNMVAGVFADSIMVRLPEDARHERLAAGWSLFEPMPGRPMREYVGLPPNLVADPDAARVWVERAVEYVRTMPPKEAKPRKASKRSS